ncbi:MAG: hypothetical protein H7A20_11965 [Rhodanobacteraceae bacterium]|nr:hypothetical protein [Rhodanobacteraceae bacterium]HRY00114.1 hypothetical protein [Xanthomonadaceae bacterium]
MSDEQRPHDSDPQESGPDTPPVDGTVPSAEASAEPPGRDPAIARGKSQAIAAILGLSLINGMLVTKFGGGLEGGSSPTDLLTALALFAVGFWWLHLDGREFGYRRSPLFNVGIVLLALFFVPLYFMQTRPPGKRLPPVLGFFGLILASSVAAAVGAMMAGGDAGAAL